MTAKRGDGIGLEVTTTLVRGVRLAHDEPGRVAAVCEVPIARFDDATDVVDALVRARARLGDVAMPVRAAWFPAGSTVQRTDATGRTASEINRLTDRLATALAVTSTMLVDLDARRWMLVLRWDHQQVQRLRDLVGRAGFGDPTIEPAPLSLGRVLDRNVTVARRDASAGQHWAGLYEHGPVAAACVDADGREFPGLVTDVRPPGLSDLDDILDEHAVAREVERLAATSLGTIERGDELDARLRVLDDPYPPFPAHDLRAPKRVAVALGAAVGAAGLAGRIREVSMVTALRPAADVAERPWAVERLSGVDELHDDEPTSRWVVLRRRLRRSGTRR